MYSHLLRFSYIGSAGDIARRICTVAELKFYFNYLFEAPLSSNYLKPNRNCNLTTWIPGCEPGWACSIGNQQVDLKEATNMPQRTVSCDTCCEGFFCPYGLTCMIRKYSRISKLSSLIIHIDIFLKLVC